MKFKNYRINEADEKQAETKSDVNSKFDQKAFLDDALEWLEKKFPDNGFTFKHKENLTNDTKTYSVSINDKEFDIAGRLMDTNSDGNADTVLFRIDPVEVENEEDNETF